MGVNKYRLEKEEQVDVLSIDNSKTIKSQIAKLEHLFATRDQEKVKEESHYMKLNSFSLSQ